MRWLSVFMRNHKGTNSSKGPKSGSKACYVVVLKDLGVASRQRTLVKQVPYNRGIYMHTCFKAAYSSAYDTGSFMMS